jgi:hypothetical protein
LDEPEQEHDNGQQQQKVNETTHRVGSDKSQKPQSKQNNKDCPDHMILLTNTHFPQDYGLQAELTLFISVRHPRVSSVKLMHLVTIAHCCFISR